MGKKVYETSIKKNRFSKKKILLGILGFIVILGLAVFLFANGYINKSLPETEGTVELSMLENEVTVITDEDGVPHIQADNARDLYIAQGYIQADRRMFQMELSRRQASGTLSEVIGEDAVSQDKYFRTLGLRRAAEESYEVYSEESIEVLEDFAAGVNAYIEEAKANNSLPIEFKLMGFEPEEWTPVDSLTIGKYMAFDLGGHWEQQAFNYYLLNEYDEEKAYELFPAYPENRPTIIKDGELDIAASFEDAVIPHPFNGSNNWVVSGDKTASGLPLLADDPHLGLATPSIWLQMHLESEDGLNVSGVIFAGVPGIILGHNDQIAWGVTNTGPDVQQLYIEKRNPDNANEFLYEDAWEEATIIEEPIKVKDGETIHYEVTETRHGPIISEFAEDTGKETVLSLKWTALDASTELEAIMEMNRAADWEEFEEGLEKFLVPAQNFVFASQDGTIAYKANGKIPIYEDGKDALLPLNGWEAENEWQDFIPFDELPAVVNPEKGFIATANNKIAPDNYPYHISNVWAQPYRYERIEEVLESGDNFTVEDMQNLQMDQTDLRAREFVPFFQETLSDIELTEQEQKALKLLADWDFTADKDKPQPLIFEHWMQEIQNEIYEGKIPDTMRDLFSTESQSIDNMLRLDRDGEQSIWLDENGGVENVLHSSLQAALEKLEEDYGEEMSAWTWGDYHQVPFNHPLSGVSPFLAFFFNKEDAIPVGGTGVTPMAASYNSKTGEVDHGASWRFVIDADDMNAGYHIVGPGQDGHFRSEWYHDQMSDWVEGNYHETRMDEADGLELKLVPEE
ncbi:penicillin acylase family protein [Oceanobacillus neutriphilus]|uniref:Beta-lactam antibiotic acylase n=1 Tax=Oceanobacillus neutriphilus TaxID=531815 RepID=A0ABQ2NUS4_9BACI|nr:penicillin acylase family protein [Oceanobacillus neutriphilus]GGP11102.1 beta-lactam antibiotic acylase [Oceanobacillus neutriphilus]